MDFLGLFVEVGDGLMDRELNAKLATVLVDFGLYLVASVVTLQFVGFGERCLLIPDLCSKDVRRLLINGCHDYGSETLGTKLWRSGDARYSI